MAKMTPGSSDRGGAEQACPAPVNQGSSSGRYFLGGLLGFVAPGFADGFEGGGAGFGARSAWLRFGGLLFSGLGVIS